MKKRLILIGLTALALILTSCMYSVKETSTSKIIKIEEENTDNQKKPSPKKDEQTPSKNISDNNDSVENKKEEDVSPVFDTDDFLEKVNMIKVDNFTVSDVAEKFLDSIVNCDKDAVAEYTRASEELYDFIDDMKISSYELTAIKEKENTYDTDTFSDYLCTLKKNDGTELYYYLATEDFGSAEVDDIIRIFMPIDMAVGELNPDSLAIKSDYYYFATQFVNNYCFLLDNGTLNASDIDFSDYNGFHFIPHFMNYLSDEWENPHSLTEINEFIANTFYENEGVKLETPKDYELWVSVDGNDITSYGPDDKVYGCFKGHGGKWVESVVCGYESNKGGVKITIQTYADKIKFAKAKKIVLNFAGEIDGEPPLLYDIEVLENTGFEEAVGSV